jgi:Protein of unknown function (DUF742)
VSAPKDRWLDQEAGPIVRPYAVTRGRTMPASDSYVGLIDMVLAEPYPQLPADARINSEHRRLLSRCHQQITVVDLASDANLPVGVVRVLVSDLSRWGAVRLVQTPRGPVTDEQLLRDVLDGLQAL